MTNKEFKDIALHAAKGTAPANFSNENVNAAFIDGLKELASTYNQFQRNKYDIFDIFIETIDEIMPKKVIQTLSQFAEVQVVADGQKAMFKKKLGRNRAKKFLTQVGLSGVYETFRLDSDTFTVNAHAVGGGATIDFERMMDGAESLAEVLDIVTEGLTDAVFYEVQKALASAFTVSTGSQYATPNQVAINGFDAAEMVKLINTVRAYGDGVAIFACPEFIAAMGPDAIVPAISNAAQGIYHPDDIDSIHMTGYIRIFRGTPIVMLPQSFIDESNTSTWLNPQYAYILPTGGEKVVKVVLEGATRIREFENRDNSMEVYAWKKMGAAILYNHNWAIYKNTSIVDTSASPYNF